MVLFHAFWNAGDLFGVGDNRDLIGFRHFNIGVTFNNCDVIASAFGNMLLVEILKLLIDNLRHAICEIECGHLALIEYLLNFWVTKEMRKHWLK